MQLRIISSRFLQLQCQKLTARPPARTPTSRLDTSPAPPLPARVEDAKRGLGIERADSVHDAVERRQR